MGYMTWSNGGQVYEVSHEHFFLGIFKLDHILGPFDSRQSYPKYAQYSTCNTYTCKLLVLIKLRLVLLLIDISLKTIIY